jgi:hypothetical protein
MRPDGSSRRPRRQWDAEPGRGKPHANNGAGPLSRTTLRKVETGWPEKPSAPACGVAGDARQMGDHIGSAAESSLSLQSTQSRIPGKGSSGRRRRNSCKAATPACAGLTPVRPVEVRLRRVTASREGDGLPGVASSAAPFSSARTNISDANCVSCSEYPNLHDEVERAWKSNTKLTESASLMALSSSTPTAPLPDGPLDYHTSICGGRFAANTISEPGVSCVVSSGDTILASTND